MKIEIEKKEQEELQKEGVMSWPIWEKDVSRFDRFFSSVVRVQTDRGHVVCDTGPYRFVRHPGYSGNIIPLFGIVLALGSVWTLIPAVVTTIISVIRTALEDQTLQEELSGYRDYAQRVRYRLIPGIF